MIGVNNDNLDALILLSAHVLEESNLRQFDDTDVANVELPASLDRKVRRLIKQEQKARHSPVWLPYVKRAVAAVLVICTVAFAAAMSIEAVRNEVWQAIVRWYDTYIAISFADSSADTSIAPEAILTKREPTDLPEGWVKEVHVDSQSLYKLVYLNEGKSVLTYKQVPLQSNAWVNSDGAMMKSVAVGVFSAKLVSLPESQYFVLYWSDGVYNYVLHSVSEYITPELMIRIAASVE